MKLALILALKHLRYSPQRTLTLAAAVMAACLISVVFTSLSNGIRASLLRSSTALIGGHINVTGVYKPRKEKSFAFIREVDRVREVLAAVPGVEQVVERHRFAVRVAYRDKSIVVPGAMGVSIDQEGDLAAALYLGTVANGPDGARVQAGSLDRLKEPNSICMFERPMEMLGVKLGDTVALSTLTMRNVQNVLDAEIVCILGNVGTQSVWHVLINKETMSNVLAVPPQSTGMLSVRLHDIAQTNEVRAAVIEALKAAKFSTISQPQVLERARAAVYNSQSWSGEKLAISTWEEELWANRWVLDVMQVLHIGVLIAICTVIGIGVANASLLAARERAPQVGLLRALGMPRYKISLELIIEMCLLTMIAASAGIVLGIGATHALEALRITVDSGIYVNGAMTNKLTFQVDWRVVTTLLTLTAAVTVAGSILGALRAMQVQPTVALRHVN